MITYDDFSKLDIRMGTIRSAEKVKGSEKLLKLEIDLGQEKRQIIAGISKAYPRPKLLIGKQVPILANLEPRRLMGLESQGMLLAADEEGMPVLLHPKKKLTAGSSIR